MAVWLLPVPNAWDILIVIRLSVTLLSVYQVLGIIDTRGAGQDGGQVKEGDMQQR